MQTRVSLDRTLTEEAMTAIKLYTAQLTIDFEVMAEPIHNTKMMVSWQPAVGFGLHQRMLLHCGVKDPVSYHLLRIKGNSSARGNVKL